MTAHLRDKGALTMYEADLDEERVIFGDSPVMLMKSSQNSSVISVSGSLDGFAVVQEPLVRDIAAQPFSWIRTSGHEKQIHCRVQFHKLHGPVSAGAVLHPGLGTPSTDPVLYSYWADNSNLDTYKLSVKPQLTAWMEELTKLQIRNWIIVVLVTPDQKPLRARVTPRLDVYERIVSDFCSKPSDHGRCVFLMDPRSGMGDADAWYNCVSQFRQLIFQSYEAQLRMLEDRCRQLKDGRHTSSSQWHFGQYFDLQIALVKCYERLGLKEEALLSIDDTSSTISRLVCEGSMKQYSALATKDWLGVNLNRRWKAFRELLETSNIDATSMSLLDVRTFLFIYQYDLLRELGRDMEIIDRAVAFVRDVNLDTKLLTVEMTPGALLCWSLLTCNEVRQICQSCGDGVAFVSLQSLATLLDLERNMLEETGVLCGLMPGEESSKEHQLLLAELTKAIESSLVSTAIVRLYETLSSADKFTKAFLELSEMTMGTFKHVGRIRTVKLLGVQLATFYMKLGMHEKAMGFLFDALKFFKSESWSMACAEVADLYIECARATCQWDCVLRGCMLIASCPEMNGKKRQEHLSTIQDMTVQCDLSSSMAIAWPDAFVATLSPDIPQQVIVHQPFPIALQLDCHLPSAMVFEDIRLSLEAVATSVVELRSPSQSPLPVQESFLMGTPKHRLKDKEVVCSSTLDNDLDKSHSRQFAAVTCALSKHQLKDVDVDILHDSDNFSAKCTVNKVEPGRQLLTFSVQLPHVGEYRVARLLFRLAPSLTFATGLDRQHTIDVLPDEVSCKLQPADGTSDLWMNSAHSFRLSLEGLPQHMESATISVQPTDPLYIDMIKGQTTFKTLSLDVNKAGNMEFRIICTAPYTTYDAELEVYLPWREEPVGFAFKFKAPIQLTHTIRTSIFPSPVIFVASTMKNLLNCTFHVTQAELQYGGQTAQAVIQEQAQLIVLPPLATVTTLWKLADEATDSTEMLFHFNYSPSDESDPNFTCHQLESKFSPGKFDQMRVKIGFCTSCKDPVTVTVGDKVELLYTINVHKFPEGLTLFYQISYDVHFWHSEESTSGSVQFPEGQPVEIKSAVVSLKSGKTVIPSLRLFYLQEEEICPLDFFHVYNESLYQIITVRSREIPDKDKKVMDQDAVDVKAMPLATL